MKDYLGNKKGKSHLTSNWPAQHYYGSTSSALKCGYYTKGPNKRKQHKKNYSTQVWRASIAKANPCSFRPSSSFDAASFDPFELKIQASNHRKLEHEAGAFSQLEADDETENPVPFGYMHAICNYHHRV